MRRFLRNYYTLCLYLLDEAKWQFLRAMLLQYNQFTQQTYSMFSTRPQVAATWVLLPVQP
jgi:hypothetical protein